MSGDLEIRARGRYPFPASFAGASESTLEAIKFALKCRGFVDVEVSRLEAQRQSRVDYENGKIRGGEGAAPSDNPYPNGKPGHEDWERGRLEAQPETREQPEQEDPVHGALQSVRLLASRWRSKSTGAEAEAWGHILRFCEEGGAVGSIPQPAPATIAEPAPPVECPARRVLKKLSQVLPAINSKFWDIYYGEFEKALSSPCSPCPECAASRQKGGERP